MKQYEEEFKIKMVELKNSGKSPTMANKNIVAQLEKNKSEVEKKQDGS